MLLSKRRESLFKLSSSENKTWLLLLMKPIAIKFGQMCEL